MDEWNALRAERDELERRLVELEQAVEAQRLRLVAQDGVQVEAADLAASVEALLARLEPVNTKLAELRGPAAST